ncbi:class I SAM-dependent methyltransferase [Isosphaera pallida]|nr:class I SAM-dependent methyltransferase [Isosphaera pallida]
MNLSFWLQHPRLIGPRLLMWAREVIDPDRPWLCPGTIRFCQRALVGSQLGIEFGGGRSTLWLAGLTQRLITIEHDQEWHRWIEWALRRRGMELEPRRVDLRWVPLDHPLEEPERPEYDPIPRYVAQADTVEDSTLDFALIDGHYRTQCVRRILPKLRPGGLLIVDDVNLWPSLENLPVPSSWTIADDSSNGLKRCVIWRVV